jgi:hypothetical protein
MRLRDAYCTQIGPDGSGHDRCGAAVVASCLLSEGWDSDPWELMLKIATENGIENRGATSQQVMQAGAVYGFAGDLWQLWKQALEAIDQGHAVLALLDNRYLVPRSYPPGASWNAMHWIRIVRAIDNEAYCYVYDPLTYCAQEIGVVYQGPGVYTTGSIRGAIMKSAYPEAGVILRSASGKNLNG